MDIHQKVDTLSQSATLDCEGPPTLTNAERKAQFVEHSRAYVTHPQRGKIPVMRILQTSACERNCYYCPFQAGRNYRRVSLAPTELADSFDQMQQKKLVIRIQRIMIFLVFMLLDLMPDCLGVLLVM